MKMRLILCLTCCALILSALLNLPGFMGKPVGDPVAAAAQVAEAPIHDVSTKPQSDRPTCKRYVHGGTGGCAVAIITATGVVDGTDRTLHLRHWVEPRTNIEKTSPSPELPPPIVLS